MIAGVQHTEWRHKWISRSSEKDDLYKPISGTGRFWRHSKCIVCLPVLCILQYLHHGAIIFQVPFSKKCWKMYRGENMFGSLVLWDYLFNSSKKILVLNTAAAAHLHYSCPAPSFLQLNGLSSFQLTSSNNINWSEHQFTLPDETVSWGVPGVNSLPLQLPLLLWLKPLKKGGKQTVEDGNSFTFLIWNGIKLKRSTHLTTAYFVNLQPESES